MSHLACPVHFTLPRRVYVEVGSLRPLVAAACERWNAIRPGLFLVVDEPAAPVHVVLGPRTWVLMPFTSAESVLHWGDEAPDYWMAHELGHTLGLGDHVWAGLEGSGYRNPQVDAATDPARYRGVMSYLDPPDGWFGEDDRRMVNHHFATAGKVILPMVAT